MKGQTKSKKESLSKKDMISSIANFSGLSKADSTRALDAIIQSIQKELAQGNDIRLTGFGTFCVKKRKARDGRNPRTGKTIKIAATTLPKFKAGKNLKEAIA
jgi:DNA-binding protein HU-beta